MYALLDKFYDEVCEDGSVAASVEDPLQEEDSLHAELISEIRSQKRTSAAFSGPGARRDNSATRVTLECDHAKLSLPKFTFELDA